MNTLYIDFNILKYTLHCLYRPVSLSLTMTLQIIEVYVFLGNICYSMLCGVYEQIIQQVKHIKGSKW